MQRLKRAKGPELLWELAGRGRLKVDFRTLFCISELTLICPCWSEKNHFMRCTDGEVVVGPYSVVELRQNC